jgi:hypothetical protein
MTNTVFKDRTSANKNLNRRTRDSINRFVLSGILATKKSFPISCARVARSVYQARLSRFKTASSEIKMSFGSPAPHLPSILMAPPRSFATKAAVARRTNLAVHQPEVESRGVRNLGCRRSIGMEFRLIDLHPAFFKMAEHTEV